VLGSDGGLTLGRKDLASLDSIAAAEFNMRKENVFDLK
jgi:hypothetical protein